MSGAMFSIRKAVIAASPLDPAGSSLLPPSRADLLHLLGDVAVAARTKDLFGELLLGSLLDVPLARIRDHPAQEREALDQLGERLDDQQEEAHRHEQPRGPDDQTAGVRRYFVPLPRVD